MPENNNYFDFQLGEEVKEQLDFKHLVSCPHCQKPIPKDATMCYYCGQTVYPSTSRPWWIIATALFILTAFLLMIIL